MRAGDVEVIDLGTKFLVSRESNRTLVAVEEGVVSVKTPSGSREVRAGSAVSWSNGTLTEMDWEPAPPVAQAPVTNTPAPERESIARLDEEDEDDAPPPPEEVAVVEKNPDTKPVGMDEEWATPPPPKTPKPPAPRVVGVVKPNESGFSIKKLERRLRAAGARFGASNRRDAEVRNITISADAGDCRYALELVDKWLGAPTTSALNEPVMRRTVKAQQIKCLLRLGRTEEAAAFQRQLDPLP